MNSNLPCKISHGVLGGFVKVAVKLVIAELLLHEMQNNYFFHVLMFLVR